MDFKDLLGKKLQEEQAVSAAAKDRAERAASNHAVLVAELEPKLRSLVLDVFAALQSSGLQPVDVMENDAVTGVLAYGLGSVRFNRWGNNPEAEVAIDSEGRMALRHSVSADKERPHTVRRCAPLKDGHSKLLQLACRDDEPRGVTRVHLDRAGELMFTDQYIASDDWKYRRMPLAEYLAGLAAKAITGA